MGPNNMMLRERQEKGCQGSDRLRLEREFEVEGWESGPIAKVPGETAVHALKHAKALVRDVTLFGSLLMIASPGPTHLHIHVQRGVAIIPRRVLLCCRKIQE
jgi:hypothetical protein